MTDEQITRSHSGTKEPPVIATKDQMGVGNSSYLCWGTSVTGIAGNCERLWRYEFAERDGATVVTESFSHPPYVGWQKFVYGRLANRHKAMTNGMQATLDRIKQSLER